MCRASIKKNEQAPTFCALLQRQTWEINSSLWLTSFANQAQLQSSVGIVCGSAVIFLRSIAFVIPFFSIVVWPSKKALIRNNRPMHQVWRVSIHNNILNGRRTLDLVFCLRAHPFHQERLTSPSFDSTPASSYLYTWCCQVLFLLSVVSHLSLTHAHFSFSFDDSTPYIIIMFRPLLSSSSPLGFKILSKFLQMRSCKVAKLDRMSRKKIRNVKYSN